MTKYIIGEIFSSGGATLYKNSSDQTVIFSVFFSSVNQDELADADRFPNREESVMFQKKSGKLPIF